nr:LysR family substrate-binding domain-containing protein [Pantoea sp. DY-15]
MTRADTVLNIAFPRSLMINLLPESIRIFSEKYNDVSINLTEILSEYQPELIANQTIDIGITREFEGDCIVPSNLNHQLILIDPLFAAIPRNHYLAKKSFLTIHDFCRSPFISYPKDNLSGFANKILNYFSSHQCMPVISHRAVEIHTALALVGAGLGVTLLGKTAIHDTRKDILFLPFEDFKINSYIYAISNPDNCGTHVTAFIDVLKSILS